jgi:homeobox protein cut-like
LPSCGHAELDLETLRRSLDEKGLAIAEAQEVSVASRKRLAERTKEFKKSVQPDDFRSLAPLLKLYQEEVDALTNRAKFAQAAFLEVFKKMYEAPDPVHAIAEGLGASSRNAELEAKVLKTAQELEEYKTESRNIKNQQITIRRLEEKIRALEAECSAKDSEIETARRSAVLEIESRTAEEARKREERLQAELMRAEEGLEAMRRMHQATQAQLFQLQEKGEEAVATSRAEAELVAAEVDRAQERLALLTKERDSLLAQISKSSSEKKGSGDRETSASPLDPSAPRSIQEDEEEQSQKEAVSASSMFLEAELKAQRDLAARLHDELQSALAKIEAQDATFDSRMSALNHSLSASTAHVAALESELSTRPTRAELEDARQQIRVLRAVVHNTITTDDGDGDGDGDEEDGSAISVTSLESALLAKNRTLEHGLTMARLEAAEAKTMLESTSSKLVEYEAEVERLKQTVTALEGGLLDASPTKGQSEASEAFVSALRSQRDRLRARVQELETEMASMAHECDRLRRELDASRSDNGALAERLRFATVQETLNNRDLERGGGGGKGWRGFALPDRAAYAVSSVLLGGNRITRSAILVYALALHVVAFIVLGGFTHRAAINKLDALETLCSQHALLGNGTHTGGVLDPVVGG